MSDTAPKAKATKVKTEAIEAPATTGKGRPSAIITDIDFSGIDQDALSTETLRRSPWDDVLNQVYDATEAGKIGRDTNGKLLFVKIGSYASSQSAKAQIKAFTQRKLDGTYEFTVAQKELFVRVRETD